jgi:hypothetical protein
MELSIKVPSKYLKIISKVDNILQNNLSKKEYNRLNTLVRSINAWSRMGYQHMKSDIQSSDNVIVNHIFIKIKKIFPIAHEIISLYDKANVNDLDWVIHWDCLRSDQIKCNEKYQSNDRPPRQDNKTYINKGNGYPHPGKIRYPRKKRKTAWKRFYKLFPHLNPETMSNNNVYKRIAKTHSKKQNKILHDGTKHHPNKDEAKLLRKLMADTGLTEEEIRSHKKYRKMLSHAQKKSEESKYSEKYKLYRDIVDKACIRTKLANQHPKTIKEIENIINEYNNQSSLFKSIGAPKSIPVKSAKSIVDYVNKNKKK